MAVIVVDGLRQGPRPVVFLNSTIFGLAAGRAVSRSWPAAAAPDRFTTRPGPCGGPIATRFLVNETLLSVAISIDSGRAAAGLRDDVRDLIGAAVGEGCLAVLVAFGYTRRPG